MTKFKDIHSKSNTWHVSHFSTRSSIWYKTRSWNNVYYSKW